MTHSMDPKSLTQIQKLIEGNFTGRDELYAAADSLDDDRRASICKRLADHLANNAIELQQIVAANGWHPADPLDMDAIAHALFDLAKSNRGAEGVLDAAAEGEHNLREDYDRAIESTEDNDTKAMLDRQRDEVEFGEEVLRNIQKDRKQEG